MDKTSVLKIVIFILKAIKFVIKYSLLAVLYFIVLAHRGEKKAKKEEELDMFEYMQEKGVLPKSWW